MTTTTNKKCGTEHLGTMSVITGCGQQSCRCRVEQTCATCGATYTGRESRFRDPQCMPCFQNEILSEEWPEAPDDGVDGLERWLS